MLEAFGHLSSYHQYYPFHDEKLSKQIYLDAAAKHIKVLKQFHYMSGDDIVWGERGSRSWEILVKWMMDAGWWDKDNYREMCSSRY